MRATPGEWDDLRLAAKAADRAKAAEKLRPAFEKRLRELGYPPLAIAHAFSTLTTGTVEEALAELEENARLARIMPVPLDFEVVEREPALPVGYSLTITDLERNGLGIRITYEIRPPLSPSAHGPRVEARDELDHEYAGTGGGFVGLAGSIGRTMTIGGFALPLPHQHASLLRVRMSWSTDATSLWERPAHELRITL